MPRQLVLLLRPLARSESLRDAQGGAPPLARGKEQRSNSWLAAEAIREYVDLREAHLAEIEAGLRSLDEEPSYGLAEAKKRLRASQRRRV